jgi:hypothetical protein
MIIYERSKLMAYPNCSSLRGKELSRAKRGAYPSHVFLNNSRKVGTGLVVAKEGAPQCFLI